MTDSRDLPAVAGAYALVIDLARPLALDIPRLSPATLAPGRYLYAGSARGPGGIRARAGRHLRADKRLHWHIDQLTAAAPPLGAIALVDGEECDVVQRLLASGATAPVLGFGSSDCRSCPAHLLTVA